MKAGTCRQCQRKTAIHIVGVGSFCAIHYLAYVHVHHLPITAALLDHYRRMANAEIAAPADSERTAASVDSGGE